MFKIDLIEPGIAELTIDYAERRNAISVEGWKMLRRVLGNLPSETRVLLLRGVGDFSAGADLSEFGLLEDDSTARTRFREAMRGGVAALAELQVPVIAVIDGGCYGAGVALALGADIRIAGPNARFATTPARIGIGFLPEDIARLRAAVGPGWAARMLFAAQPLDAATALRAGLVEEVADDTEAAALSLARPIASNSTQSIRFLKRVLNNPDANGHDRAFDGLFGGDDFREGYAAYRSRRTPRFA